MLMLERLPRYIHNCDPLQNIYNSCQAAGDTSSSGGTARYSEIEDTCEQILRDGIFDKEEINQVEFC